MTTTKQKQKKPYNITRTCKTLLCYKITEYKLGFIEP